MTDAALAKVVNPRVQSPAQPFVERRSVANHVLNSIGECAYEWDIESDQLLWSEGAEQLLCVNSIDLISSSRRFNGLMLPTDRIKPKRCCIFQQG